MQTPSAKYFCPSCQSSYASDTPFCGQCGGDMRKASRLTVRSGDEQTPRKIRKATISPAKKRHTRGGDPWLGRVVDDRYRVEEVLGRGGMGVVYKIKHERMGKVAAMKVLHSDIAQDPEIVARFQREAEAVSMLAHPNTVQVFDFGAMDGALYLVMEYVRGQDLGALVDRDGALSFQDAAPLLGQICASLEEAHDLGIVHRDLKPENILVSRTHSGQDFIKVLDFGLAKLTESEDLATVTSAGSIVGTPYYMSPEQIRADESVDHRSDIYSLGAMLFRLVTGDNAFNAKTPMGVLTKHLTDEVEAASERWPDLEIPKELDGIIAKCMAKSPEDRYQSVRALREDIEQLFVESFSDTSEFRMNPTSWLGTSDTQNAPVSAMLEGDIDYGMRSGMRLLREDLDHFEKKLRRQRSLRRVLLPLMLLMGAAAALYALVLRPESASLEEIEGNNDMGSATLIETGTEVKGTIGKRRSKTQPDSDFFRFTTQPNPHGGDVVSVKVTAPPNVDIQIELFNTNGALLTSVNQSPAGGAEVLRRWRASGAVIVSVAGVAPSHAGQFPTENVSDPYVLSVDFDSASASLESEPNDSTADASPLTSETTLGGFLDSREDVDVYRLQASAGRFTVSLAGCDPSICEWRVGETGAWHREASAVQTFDESRLLFIRHRENTPQGPDTQGPDTQGPDTQGPYGVPYKLTVASFGS